MQVWLRGACVVIHGDRDLRRLEPYVNEIPLSETLRSGLELRLFSLSRCVKRASIYCTGLVEELYGGERAREQWAFMRGV